MRGLTVTVMKCCMISLLKLTFVTKQRISTTYGSRHTGQQWSSDECRKLSAVSPQNFLFAITQHSSFFFSLNIHPTDDSKLKYSFFCLKPRNSIATLSQLLLFSVHSGSSGHVCSLWDLWAAQSETERAIHGHHASYQLSDQHLRPYGAAAQQPG